MANSITIRFQRENMSETISNAVLVGIGMLLIFFGVLNDNGLIFLGICFSGWGVFGFSKFRGVLVEPGQPFVWPFKSYLGMKAKESVSLKDIESVMVKTGTQVHGGSNGMFVSHSTSFMVYQLYLLPNEYSKREKIYLSDFFTKEECMLAAEELSKATGLPLVLKIRK